MSSASPVRPGDVAATARMMAAAGLAEAFGHVSARTPSGFLITSTRPLFDATADDVIVVESGRAVSGAVDAVPLETPMHAAIYEARRDVGAICRGHPPYAVVWGIAAERLPLLHGLGGISSGVVQVHSDIELVKSPEAAAEVAGTLGDDFSVLLQANGCLSVGKDLLEAVTRLWFLEERARVVVQARSAGLGMMGKRERIWRRRLEDSEAELIRAMVWMLRTYGTPGDDSRSSGL